MRVPGHPLLAKSVRGQRQLEVLRELRRGTLFCALCSKLQRRDQSQREISVSSAAAAAARDSLQGPEIDVWSFNLRTELVKEDDAENSWAKRRDEVAALIRKYDPAVVCTQEATVAMLSHLCKRLDGRYCWKGISRKLDGDDECAGFLFNIQQVELLDHSVFWLSPPACPDGHPGWDAKLPRTCEVAMFKIRDELSAGSLPMKMRILNTHFDHEGVAARSKSAALILDAIIKFNEQIPGCPQILCGDFNSPKSSEPYGLLSDALQDVFRCASDIQTFGAQSTIHKWQGLSFDDGMGDGTVDLSKEDSRPDSRYIDWILWLNGRPSRGFAELQLLRCRVLTDTLPNGRYPSDHFPLSATFVAIDSNHQSRL